MQVLCQPVYGGVNATVDKILVKLGLEVTYIKGNSLEEYKKAIKPNTKVVTMYLTMYDIFWIDCVEERDDARSVARIFWKRGQNLSAAQRRKFTGSHAS